jgi:multicomponent Na+:H+ antiporter subunit D
MPWTMASIVIGGLSLIGVPPTAGFITKWYLLLGTLEQGLWPVAVLVLIGSLLALLYVWKLVETAYFEPVPEGAPPVREAPWSMLLPIWLLVGANIYFGIHTEVTVGLATQAANELMGIRP